MGEQVRRTWTVADVLSVVRVPMAIAFVLVSNEWWRLGIVALAGLTDLLDGRIARRYGSSRIGPIVDPIADKLFMACAFGVVAFSGRLEWYEIVGVLLRDIIATVAFVATGLFGRAVVGPGAGRRQGGHGGAADHAGGLPHRLVAAPAHGLGHRRGGHLCHLGL